MCWRELPSCFSDSHWSVGNMCWKINFTVGVCRLLLLTLGTVVTFNSGKKHGCLKSSLWLQDTSKVLRQDIWKNILRLSWVINNYMKHCFRLLTLFISHLKEIEVPTGKCVSSNEHYLSNMHWFVLELYKSKHVCILELFSIILCFVIFSLEIITYVCVYVLTYKLKVFPNFGGWQSQFMSMKMLLFSVFHPYFLGCLKKQARCHWHIAERG